MSKRFELGMMLDYAHTWTVFDGIREFFQNALDEEREHEGNQMTFEYLPGEERLIIGNKNSVLELKTLLLGYSTKRDRSDLIGQHGDGYKTGTVVLLRNGKGVTIYNNKLHEKWVAKVVKSRRYGTDIVVFDVERTSGFFRFRENSEDLNLIIAIDGITEEEMQEYKRRNLHLWSKEELGDIFETNDIGGGIGRVLLDEQFKGEVYVNGLYVCKSDSIAYGYDMPSSLIKLDRDRGLVDNFNLLFNVSRLHMSASLDEFIQANLNKPDLRYVDSFICSRDRVGLVEKVQSSFVSKHGASAIPVVDVDEFNEASKAGNNAVLVSAVEYSLLSYGSGLPSLQSVRSLDELFDDWCEKATDYLSEELMDELKALWVEARS